MESFIVTTKDKATSMLLRKMLKAVKGVDSISSLSKEDKEEIALIRAINKGHSKKYVSTEQFLKKLEQK
ncbi:MAG: hypothetical protein K2X48_05245 [Chitinophagaceae bacterium]|nr:hypothetical protein [Chitinophagaceae bacterium]